MSAESEPRDIVLEASLALSTISNTIADKGAQAGLRKEVDVLCDLLELLQTAGHAHAAGAYLMGYRPVYGLICQFCEAVTEVKGHQGPPTLLGLVYALQTHSCDPQHLARAEEVRKAEEALLPCERAGDEPQPPQEAEGECDHPNGYGPYGCEGCGASGPGDPE
jgi:hypothetical protein